MHMPLILHHAMKDLRGMRAPLVVWLALLLTDCLLQSLKVDRFVRDADQLSTLVNGLTILGGCTMVLGWALAAMIVQADPLDSSSAFWLTRPLSRRGLLASKLLVIVSLFLLLATATATVVGAANGVGGLVLLELAAEHLLIETALLVPVLLAASVSHNLARTMLVLTTGVLGYLSIHFAAMMAGIPRDVGARGSGVLLAVALIAIGSLCLLAHQYFSRATRRTRWLAAGTLALAVIVGDFWPWNVLPFITPRPPDLDARVFDPAPVRLSLDPEDLGRGESMAGRPRISTSATLAASGAASEQTVDIRGSLRADGVPPGWFVRVVRGNAELRLGAEPAIKGQVGGYFNEDTPDTRTLVGSQTMARDLAAAFEATLDARIVNRVAFVPGISVALPGVPERMFEQQRDVPGAFRSTLEVQATRLAVSGPIALRPGATSRTGRGEVTLERFNAASREGTLTIRQASARPILGGESPELHLVLLNRRTREAFFPTSTTLTTGTSTFRGLGIRLTYRTLSVPERSMDVIDARWLADAELWLVLPEGVGMFEKRLDTDNFLLPQRYYSRR